MRPVNTHRKLRIRGDSMGSSTRYKLADPVTPTESSRLDFSVSEDGLDSAPKIQTLPDYRPFSKEKNLLEKTKTSSKPNLTAFSLKTLLSFPEIATERGKLYHPSPPPIFEKNLYEKNQRMIKMTKLMSEYMAEKIVKRASSLSNQIQNSQKSLNYVILGKNPESTQTAEQLAKRQSLPPPPSSTLRRLNTEIEECAPRMRLRHQNSIEDSNSNIPLATFFKNSEKSKSPPRQTKNYSRSPDEKIDLNPKSLEKIANNFFVKNKDKFHIATPLKKRAAELNKEQFASTKAEWLKKALASHRAKLKPQFKAL